MVEKVEIRLPHRWKPRDYQRGLWRYLEGGGVRAVPVWHRRAGKDDVCLHWAAVAAHMRVAGYWHMLPAYAQARLAVWEAVNPHSGVRRIDEAFPRELRATTNEQEMFIRFKNGSTWRVIGSDNYDRLVGSPPAGVVFSEWALADPAAWGYLRPILAENKGWALFIFTPRGRNHGLKILEAGREAGWFTEVLTADQTSVFTQEELGEELRQYVKEYGEEQGRALYEQEYFCSFSAAILGAFYAAEVRRMEEEGRIGKVGVDRGVPVHTAWDLGVSDSTAIWFIQAVGREFRVVDYHESSGSGFQVYADVLRQKGYLYGEHYFPHDLFVREVSTGTTRAETMRGLGIEPLMVARHDVMDGINATRRLLDRCWIDEGRCGRGLEALRNYKREYDDRLKDYRGRPLHDWSSHGADALRMFACGYVERELPSGKKRRYGKKAESGGSWMSV